MAIITKIAIIGGGISGLSTAAYLKKLAVENGIEVELTLLEKSARLGGVIRSERTNGYLLENGPEGWASYKPSAKKLIQDFNLESEVIGSKDENRKTFVVRNGQLTALPDGMTFFAPVEPIAFWRTAPLSLYGKFRSSLEPFISRSQGDISVRTFFERRLGKEFTDELVEPLISAILGGNFEKLSVQCVLQELHRVEQRTGSLWKGMRRFAKMTLSTSVLHTMADGMSTLVDKLADNLADCEIHLNMDKISLIPGVKGHVVQADSFEDIFDEVVLCTPAPAASTILRDNYPPVSKLLDELSYTSSTLVYLGFDKNGFNHPLNGFGFILPRHEARAFDACTWVNRKFDGRTPDDKILIRAAIHNARLTREIGTEEELIESVQSEFKRIMNLDCSPVFRKAYQVRNQIPQLFVGHVERKRKIVTELQHFPGLHLAGSYWGGVGIPDCIRTGQETAQSILDSLLSDLVVQKHRKALPPDSHRS